MVGNQIIFKGTNMAQQKQNGLDEESQAYADELVGSLEEGLRALSLTVRSVIEPLRDSELVINKIQELNKPELLETMVALHSTIMADMERYSPLVSSIHKEVTSHLSKKPTRKRHVGTFAANSLYLGQKLIELNSTIMQTTLRVTDDYASILVELGLD